MEHILEEYIMNEKELDYQRNKMKPLKKRQIELEKDIMDYIKHVPGNGMHYKEYTFQLENKPKITSKKLTKRREEVLTILKQHKEINSDVLERIGQSLSNVSSENTTERIRCSKK